MPPEILPNTAAQPGFLRSGWLELRRKLARRRLLKQVQQLETQRMAALAEVGQAAWKSHIDLSSHSELQEHLAALAARSGRLNAAADKLAESKPALEARRQLEAARFDSERRAADAKKQPVDASLETARRRLTEQNQLVKSLEARRVALPAETTSREQTLAALAASAAADKNAQILAVQNQKFQFELELKQVVEQSSLVQQALPSLAAEVQRLFDESQAHLTEINRIEAERKSVVSPISAELDRLQRELLAASQESVAVEKERGEQFIHLGHALYEARARNPEIAPAIAQVVAIDRTRAVSHSAVDASLAQTRTMRPGTMFKFWAAALVTPALLAAGGITAVYLLLHASSAPRSPVAWIQKEEDHKTETVKSYVRGLRDPSRRDASYARVKLASEQMLKDDIARLGGTGDKGYLPRLSKILRSDNPELRVSAARAIGRIGPTSAEIPALTSALNDPVPAVRSANLHAIERISGDSRARMFVSRTLDELRRVKSVRSLSPESAPGTQLLGVPVYPSATFLHFASNTAEGRAAFSTADSVSQVVAFYQHRARRGPSTTADFGREYLGALTLDPSAAQERANQARASTSGELASLNLGSPNQPLSPDTQMLQYLVLRYSDDTLYGSPVFLVTEESTATNQSKPVRFVVVFQDRSLNATGFIVHFPPS